jgi:hypothetical protein
MVYWSLPLREEHVTIRNPPLPPVSLPLNTGFARGIHLKHGEILIVFLTSRYDMATTTRCCSKPSMVDYWCDRVADSLSWFVIAERSTRMASIWAQYFESSMLELLLAPIHAHKNSHQLLHDYTKSKPPNKNEKFETPHSSTWITRI